MQVNQIIGGTYIIVNPVVYASLLASGFMDTRKVPNGYANAYVNPYVGDLAGYFRVYVNVWERENVILMGAKDFSGTLEAQTKAGAFFCPYLTFGEVSTIRDANGQPVSFFESFYDFVSHPMSQLVSVTGNDFFRKINVTNLPGSTTGTI